MQTSIFESKNMKTSAVISDCGMYRYELHRIWDDAKPKVLLIMLNPSTADGLMNDPTIRRCINFAKDWGYGGLLVGNLFAFRATNPLRMQMAALLQGVDIIGPDNNDHLMAMYNICQDVVYAWGTQGTLMDRDIAVNHLFEHQGYQPKCIAISKNGHPKHPLYLNSKSALINFQLQKRN